MMWAPLVFDGDNYLLRYIEAPIIKVLWTDFKRIWYEEIPINDILERFKDLNPLIDADSEEISNKIKHLINSVDSETTSILISNDDDDARLCVELKCKLPHCIIRCNFNLCIGDQTMYFNEFTLPLMQSVQYLEMRQKKLCDLLEKKDKEIQEHQLEGGEITRKSLVTQKFNRATLNESIPEALFLNVFGKSKAFYAAFTKRFGAVRLNPKIKREKGEEKVQKKLKLESNS